MSLFQPIQALKRKPEKTAKRMVTGYTTLFYACSHCHGPVDGWDDYCRWCGRRFKDE